jgi:hypothetical protein
MIDRKKLSRVAISGLKDAPALARSVSAILQLKNLPIEEAIERAVDRGRYSLEADAWLYRAFRVVHGFPPFAAKGHNHNKAQAIDRCREQLETWLAELNDLGF